MAIEVRSDRPPPSRTVAGGAGDERRPTSLTAMVLMLSPTAHGYDSCPIGGLDKLRIRRTLGLPAQAEVTTVIAFGRRRPEGLDGVSVRLPCEDL